MAKLDAYDGQTFYSSKAGDETPVPRLRKKVRHGRQRGCPYSYVVFLDNEGIK